MGDASAAHHKHVLYFGRVPAQQLEELSHAGRLADEVELVSGGGDIGAVGDNALVPPLRRAEQNGQGLDLTAQLRERMAADKVVRLDPETNELHPPAVEGLQIGRGGEPEQPGNFHGGGVLRIDDHVDADYLFQGGQLHGVLHVAHPGDGVLGTQPLGGEAADHVNFIQAGGGNQNVGMFGIRLPQGGNGRAVALDAHDVQRVGRPLEGLVPGVDNDDIVILAGQVFRQRKANFTAAYNDNLHAHSLLFTLTYFYMTWHTDAHR